MGGLRSLEGCFADCVTDLCIKAPLAVHTFWIGATLLVIGILAIYSKINISPAIAYGCFIAPGSLLLLATPFAAIKYGNRKL